MSFSRRPVQNGRSGYLKVPLPSGMGKFDCSFGAVFNTVSRKAVNAS